MEAKKAKIGATAAAVASSTLVVPPPPPPAAAAALRRDRAATRVRRQRFSGALTARGIPRRSAAAELRHQQAISAAVAAAASLALPPGPKGRGGTAGMMPLCPQSLPHSGAPIPYAPLLEPQPSSLPTFANADGYDSSDPEDIADTSLFNAVYTDLLATEQTKQSAEVYNMGVSDSDDESDGEGIDWLVGQTLVTTPEMLRRRLTYLSKLKELYGKQHHRLKRNLSNRRLAYVRERDAISAQLAKLRSQADGGELLQDPDEPQIPAARLQYFQPPPLALDIDNCDATGKRRYKYPTGLEASLLVKRWRKAELAAASGEAASKFRCKFEAAASPDGSQPQRCSHRNLPLSPYCARHILHDPEQQLYKACSFGKDTAEACTVPIVKAEDPPVCDQHLQLKHYAFNPRLCVRVSPAGATAEGGSSAPKAAAVLGDAVAAASTAAVSAIAGVGSGGMGVVSAAGAAVASAAPAGSAAAPANPQLPLLGGGLDEDFQALLGSVSVGPHGAGDIELHLENIKCELQQEAAAPKEAPKAAAVGAEAVVPMAVDGAEPVPPAVADQTPQPAAVEEPAPPAEQAAATTTTTET